MIPEEAQHTLNAYTTGGQSPDTTTVKQIILKRRSPAYWRVTFDHPPLNIFGPETIPVDALATRISSFDKQAIAETKRLVDLNSLPSDAEIAPECDAFIASLGRPAAQSRIGKLFERGFHTPGDVETRLGFHVGLLGVPNGSAPQDPQITR